MYDACCSTIQSLDFYKELLDHISKVLQHTDPRFVGAAGSCAVASQQGIKFWRTDA